MPFFSPTKLKFHSEIWFKLFGRFGRAQESTSRTCIHGVGFGYKSKSYFALKIKSDQTCQLCRCDMYALWCSVFDPAVKILLQDRKQKKVHQKHRGTRRIGTLRFVLLFCFVLATVGSRQHIRTNHQNAGTPRGGVMCFVAGLVATRGGSHPVRSV